MLCKAIANLYSAWTINPNQLNLKNNSVAATYVKNYIKISIEELLKSCCKNLINA